MKIKDIKTFVVGNPSLHRGGPYWVFVKVTTDDGVVGYGEIYGVAFHPKVLSAMVDDVSNAMSLATTRSKSSGSGGTSIRADFPSGRIQRSWVS